MKYLYIISLFGLLSCIDNDAMEFSKSCPYDLQYPGHYIKVPISIFPHNSIYHVGDTISISAVYSDSIYDLGTQRVFKIENFPFKPLSLLYKVDGNSHDSGYSINELLIDSLYEPDYNFSSILADSFKAKTEYSEEEYRFESKLILREAGRYILLFTDLYQSQNGSGHSELNEEADSVTFDGKCPTLQYYICSMIESGDDNLKMYEEELKYLDQEIYNDKLREVGNPHGPLGVGSISVQFSGFFGFEVLE